MEKIFFVIKLFINLIIFLIYSVVAVIFCDFLYGFYTIQFLGYESSTGPDDPNHLKIAVLAVVLVLVITLVFRKFFYFEVFSDESTSDKKNNKRKTKKEKLEIYVNKEIKK